MVSLAGLVSLAFLPAPESVASIDALVVADDAVPQIAEQRVWIGPNGGTLPFAFDEEVLEFLRTADVISSSELGTGATRPRKVLLEKDGVRMHAIFHHLDERRTDYRFAGRRHAFFRDSYFFECAAYELARMLGMDNIPPTVLREVEGRDGSLSAWIENSFDERDRRDRDLEPPDADRWRHEWAQMELFDQLVFNMDRNQTNLLIDPDWNLWLIDHTIAFQRYGYLDDPEEISEVERGMWERLQTIDETELRDRLELCLFEPEIEGLIERLAKVVERIRSLIEEQGEAAVVYTATRPRR